MLAEAGAGEPEGRTAGFVRGYLGFGRRLVLGVEAHLDGLHQHVFRLQAEFAQLRVGRGREELEPVADEAGRMASGLTHHAGALGADMLARVMIAQAFPEQGIEFGQRTLQPTGELVAGFFELGFGHAPRMRRVEQVEPGLDHAEIQEADAFIII